ncbi:L-threonylcarbamoyladenylate synthase [Leptothermofonsia sp. ETS-13]|uniref:L-threonylcarbamoyladenylate synthase n=1 Tax=Leptothermofonsia sp. ETS-13 TaxID=3035696 RepID=UPI003BA21C0F
MPQVSFDDLVTKAVAGESLISFPTDTVPALATRPDRAELIFEAKQRSLDKPLILMAGAIADLWPFVAGNPQERQEWEAIAERYWPGALTLVLPASDRIPAAMNPKDPTTIGVRVPDHAIARAILARTGPLATTSANLSGQPPLLTLAEIEQQFPQVLTLLPSELQRLAKSTPRREEELVASGIPSTVIRWTPTGWEVLRQGAVTVSF